MPLVSRTSTQGSLFKSDTEPDDNASGNVWMDTSSTPATMKTGTGTGYEQPSIELPNGQTMRIDKAIIALG